MTYSPTSQSIVIVGAGPAGLAMAHELLNHGVHGSNILIIDEGPDISMRVSSRKWGSDDYKTNGLGGAGLFSDGKLSFPDDKVGLISDVGTMFGSADALPNPHMAESEAIQLYRDAYTLISGFSTELLINNHKEQEIAEIKDLFARVGVLFEYYNVRQIPPDQLPLIVDKLRRHLEAQGVTFNLSTKVLRIMTTDQDTKLLHCVHDEEEITITCDTLALAIGKAGFNWLMHQAAELGLNTGYRTIEVGIRIEVPSSVLARFTNVHRDLKLLRRVDGKNLVKTFCTCVNGTVLPCWYEDKLLLGGYTGEQKSANTNFALLVKMELGDVDPNEFGLSIARTTNILGLGKPLVQRLGDLQEGRVSTLSDIEGSTVQTTLAEYTPGNINLAYPHMIVDELLNTLGILEQVVPGINSESNIVSAPCLESFNRRFVVNRHMETNIDGMYIVGDAAGYAKGLVPSAASGMLAARGVYIRARADHHQYLRRNIATWHDYPGQGHKRRW